MNTAQRRQYFMDYYLRILIFLMGMLLAAGFLIWHFFLKEDGKTMLYAAVIDESLYITAAGYKDSDEVSFEDTEVSKGEELPYGVDISGCGRFTEMTPVFQEFIPEEE